jgi:hypothetical protein
MPPPGAPAPSPPDPLVQAPTPPPGSLGTPALTEPSVDIPSTPSDETADAIEAKGATEADIELQRGAEANAKIAAEQEAQREREQQERDYVRARAIAESRLTQIAQKHAEFKFHDYWDTKTAGDKALAKIGGFFSAFGAGLTGTPDEHARRLENDISREYDQQKEHLNSIEKQEEWAKQGVADIDARRRIETAELDHKTAGKLTMVADQFASLSATNRGKLKLQEAKIEEDKYRKLAEKKETDAKKELADIALKQAQAESALATAKWTREGRGKKAKGAGGGGNPQRLANEAALSALALHGGTTEDLLNKSLADKMGIGLKEIRQIQTDARAQAGASAKATAAAAKLTADQEKLAVRWKGAPGGEIKLESSPRNVAKTRTFFINYDQAISSLEDIANDLQNGTVINGYDMPVGSKWHNSVLAIAATTTAGQTDTNVKHEAGTLTNAAGVVDLKSVKRKLQDLHTRESDMWNSLTPVKGTTVGGDASHPDMKLKDGRTARWNAGRGGYEAVQ